jgi:hypothetical protein
MGQIFKVNRMNLDLLIMQFNTKTMKILIDIGFVLSTGGFGSAQPPFTESTAASTMKQFNNSNNLKSHKSTNQQ